MNTSGTFHISFDIDGDRELSRKIHGMLGSVTDWTPVWKTIAADWSSTMARKFDTEGAHEAGTDEQGNANPPWAPLSERYAAWKERHFPGAKILQRSGDLRAAATGPATVITPSSLSLTVDSPYALFHQSSRPRKRLPRRPFASLTPKQKSRWVRAFRDRIFEAARD
jgi:phage gpG-like protein